MPNVTITYINGVTDSNAPIWVFGEDLASNRATAENAWKVIEHVGQGDYHVLQYQSTYEIQASWDAGSSFTALLAAEPGQRFKLAAINDNYMLECDGDASSPDQIELVNDVSGTPICGLLYDDGSVFMEGGDVLPKGTLAIQPVPKTFWAVGSPGTAATALTEVDLTGLASLTVTLTEGADGQLSFAVSDRVPA